jgi:hypothetical protein
MGFLRKRPGLYTAAIATTYLTLPTITTTVFGMFPCDEFDDGMSSLRSDLSIDCNASGRGAWQAYGYLMVAVFPVGVPLMYWVLLYRMRDRLRAEDRGEDEKLRGLVFLWEPYKKEYWWWEVFETLRRLAMTGLLSTIDPGSFTQISSGLMMGVVSTFLLTWFQPYAETRDNVIAALSGLLLVLTFLSAFLIASQKLVEGDYEAVGLDAVLVAATVLIITLFLAWAWYSFNDLSTSSGGMAARAFQSSIGTRSGSNGDGSGDGVEMGERRGSKFVSVNPMRKEAGTEGGVEVEVKKKKKERKGFFERLGSEVRKWKIEREYRKKPRRNIKRDQQYEDPTPRPPPELQRKPPASKIEAGGDRLLHVKKK